MYHSQTVLRNSIAMQYSYVAACIDDLVKKKTYQWIKEANSNKMSTFLLGMQLVYLKTQEKSLPSSQCV